MLNLENLKPGKGILKTTWMAGALIVLTLTANAQELFQKPEWLPQLSLGVGEGYDGNILGVSGRGLQPKGSWVSTISPGVGLDFVPLLGSNAPFQILSLGYTPNFAMYHEAPSENFNAHKFSAAIKAGAGNFHLSVDDSFIYVDGSKIAPTYALNQLSGPFGNSFDRYRNQFANTPARERRNQIQDREATSLQYDIGPAFIRAANALLLYDMDTALHSTKKAPYLGYQNYVDRSDVNGGLDAGYRVVTNLTLTLGYRYGSQYQQQFPSSVTSDFHYSSSSYQRLLGGIETKPVDWLSVKFVGGPDFRNYNRNAPVTDLHPTRFYGEGSATASITTNQTIAAAYKAWTWVASSGNVPEFDTSYTLNYRWRAYRRLELGVSAAILQADYTIGNDTAGNAPSVRIDRLYTISPSATYAFTPQLSATVSYSYNAGNNELSSLPAYGGYKNFVDQVVSLQLLYKF
jgi:hypothetical protein